MGHAPRFRISSSCTPQLPRPREKGLVLVLYNLQKIQIKNQGCWVFCIFLLPLIQWSRRRSSPWAQRSSSQWLSALVSPKTWVVLLELSSQTQVWGYSRGWWTGRSQPQTTAGPWQSTPRASQPPWKGPGGTRILSAGVKQESEHPTAQEQGQCGQPKPCWLKSTFWKLKKKNRK